MDRNTRERIESLRDAFLHHIPNATGAWLRVVVWRNSPYNFPDSVTALDFRTRAAARKDARDMRWRYRHDVIAIYVIRL